MQLMLYCCLLWSMFCLFLLLIHLICLVTKCLYVFCVFVSNLLIVFSVSTINSFIYTLGSCSIAYLGPSDNNFVCSFVSFILVMFIILCCCSAFISFCILLCFWLVLYVSASSFLLSVCYCFSIIPFICSSNLFCTCCHIPLC